SLDYLFKTYGLTFSKEINKGSLLFVTKSREDTETIIKLVDSIYKDTTAHDFVSSVSPIFLFEDETCYNNGKIVIQWGEKVRKDLAEKLLEPIGLKELDFDPDTHVMIVEPTEKSGYNIYAISQVFGPYGGNAFTASVEPQFITL